MGPGVGGRGTAFMRRGGVLTADAAALEAPFFATGAPFFATGTAFFAAVVAFLVAGVTLFFGTVTAFFFGEPAFRVDFTDRVWRVAAEPADRGRVFAADFTGRAAFRFTGFAVRAGLADLR